jgi:hypothetical protein
MLPNVLTKNLWNISDIKKNGKDVITYVHMPFTKKPTCLSGLKVTLFLKDFQILNLMTFWRVESGVLQSEKQIWRSKYSNFIILRTILSLWPNF